VNPGVLFAVAACAGWGFAFVGPQILGAWPAAAVAAGRYIAYGVWSLGTLAVLRLRHGAAPPEAGKWRMALLLTLSGNLLYYVLLSAAVQRAGVYLPTLIIGLLPVTVSMVGRLRARQPLTPAYALALSLIVAGLWLANRPAGTADAGSADLLGVLYAFAALTLWTVYAAFNTEWLQAHPRVSGLEWSSLQGAAALPFALALFAAAPQAPPAASWTAFLTVSAILGVVTSWAANAAWNLASTRLAPSLLGQMIVFETIFGIAYGALWSGTPPALPVLAGTALLTAGVVVALRERPLAAAA
jgi:drug/metabolite transporter (DMT)-like permease